MARRYPSPLTEWEKTVIWIVERDGGKPFKEFYDRWRRLEKQPWRTLDKIGDADRHQARRLREYESIKQKLKIL